MKPLLALITNGNRGLQRTKEAVLFSFDKLKKALMSAPALGLPDVNKPFFLEKWGIALAVLAQYLGSYWRAVACFSKLCPELHRRGGA